MVSRWHVCRRCWWAWHWQRRRRSHRRCRWVTRRTTEGAVWVRCSRKRLSEEVVAEAEGSAASFTAERATEERTADVLCRSWHDANDGRVATVTAERGAAPPRANGLLTVLKDVAVIGDASWGRLSKWRPHWGRRRRRRRRLRLSVSPGGAGGGGGGGGGVGCGGAEAAAGCRAGAPPPRSTAH